MELVSKPSFNVIGKKVSCTWDKLGIEMPEAWKEVIQRKNEIKNRISPYILDVCLHVKNGEFTQLIGCEVSELADIPTGFDGKLIPEQKYVYTKHTGSVMEIATAFGEMIEWAKENNLTIDPEDFKIQYTPEENEAEGYDLYFKVL